MLHFLDQTLGVLFVLFLAWLALRPVLNRIRSANARAEMARLDRLRSGMDPAVIDAVPTWDGDTLGAKLGRLTARFVGGGPLELVVAHRQRSVALDRVGRRMTADLGTAGACPVCGARADSTIVVESEGRCIACQAMWSL
jgi:hypothetical protein